MELEIHNFKAKKSGHHLLVFGSIHGNEKCGSQSAFKIIKEIENGTIKLTCGQVTFVPICNPKAYANNTRYIDKDLNRIIQPHSKPKHYEEHIANQLIEVINSCDTLLDIHSMGADSLPCIFMDYLTPENISLMKVIDVPHVLAAWEEVYENNIECQSTEHYANKVGKSVLTLECGQHNDPNAPTVAYNAIFNALTHLGITEHKPKKLKYKQEYFKFTHMFRKREGSSFQDKWYHMQQLNQGTVIGKDQTQTYTLEKDAIMIMPAPHAKIDSEWFYLAEKINSFE